VPGLVGVFSTRGPADAAARFAAASARMRRHPGQEISASRPVLGAGVAGLVRPARNRPGAEPARPAWYQGTLYNHTALRQQLDDAGPLETAADVAAALYARHGRSGVVQLDGAFAVAIADDARGRFVLATDTVGNCPIYWKADASGLVFASDVSAVLRGAAGSSRLDVQAVAEYLTIGQVMGDRTLADGVRLLDPGTVLEYDVATGAVTTTPYVRLDTLFGATGVDRRQYTEAVQAAFTAAVDRALSGSAPIGLSLSGGLDSRAILSAVNGRASGITTYTLGVEGCADQVIADRLSRIAGTRHHFFRLDDAYLRDFLPNMAAMVSATDGLYLSHGLTEMLALHFLEETGIAVLLRGHGGELAKARLAWPLHTDDRVYQMKALAELAPYLAARANYITPGIALGDLLTPDIARAAGRGSADAIEAALKGLTLSPAEACSYLYLHELHRRFTVPSLELFRTQVEVRLPFVDPSFLRVLLAAPAEWRDSTDIHQALIRSGIPRLVKVRNSNTGAPADAGRLTELALDKMNSVLKRLNVRGYRHYHNFDGWMRRMLLATVEAELLAPGARIRGVVSESALRKALTETRDGVSDRSYLLQVLLILELWQRENGVDA
jgi:asparagine synthase (glutamine-hydrolysing)